MIRGIFNTIADSRTRRDWRFLALRRIGAWLIPHYHFQWPHIAWWRDEAFNAYLSKFDLLRGADSERRWTLGQLTKLVQSVPGDTAECGVMGGSSSYLIARAFPNRTHFLFDSWDGLSQPEAVDGNYHSKRDYSPGYGVGCSLETAQQNLAEFPNLSFLKGWIPDRFGEVATRRFCFVHIDVQLYQPTRDSIEFFYPRMNSGGIIVFDDYGFTAFPGAIKAIDEFMSDKPEKLISLSSGNAFLVRK